MFVDFKVLVFGKIFDKSCGLKKQQQQQKCGLKKIIKLSKWEKVK